MNAAEKVLYPPAAMTAPAAHLRGARKGRRPVFATIIRAGMAVLAAATLLMPWGAAHAVGTVAGTTISNSATATYSVAGVAAPAVVSSVSIRVDELISVRVTAPAAPTSVIPGDLNKVLTFTVTNVGNGTESFTLGANLNPAIVDQFNPTPGSAGQLFLDSNGNGLYDPGVDTLIPPGTPVITLNADQSVKVFLVSNIPTPLTDGDRGIVTLSVVSTTPGAAAAAPGTILPNAGTPAVGVPGIDAIVGVGPGGAADSGSDDSANGTYIVAAVTVTVNKVVLNVFSPFAPLVAIGPCNVPGPPAGCSAFVPGTVVQYQVTVTVAGNGTAQTVQMTDAIPANTTYVPNSIRVNFPTAPATSARTDVVDGDNASCTGCGSATGSVTVVIGNVVVNGVTPVVANVIDYKVTIN